MKNIILIGQNGYIASSLIYILKKKNFNIYYSSKFTNKSEIKIYCLKDNKNEISVDKLKSVSIIWAAHLAQSKCNDYKTIINNNNFPLINFLEFIHGIKI